MICFTFIVVVVLDVYVVTASLGDSTKTLFNLKLHLQIANKCFHSPLIKKFGILSEDCQRQHIFVFQSFSFLFSDE